jgi:hypothetical protein
VSCLTLRAGVEQDFDRLFDLTLEGRTMLRLIVGPLPPEAEHVGAARIDRDGDTLILLGEDLSRREQDALVIDLLRQGQDSIA